MYVINVATLKIQTVFRFAQKSYLEAIEIKMISSLEPPRASTLET